MKKAVFHISFRCYFQDGEHTNHYQDMKLSEVAKWVEAYKFTHPNCISISFKIWFSDLES